MSGSSTSTRLDYFPYLTSSLFNIMANPPNNDVNEAADRTIEILNSYGLSKDDLTENLKDLKVLVFFLFVVSMVSVHCSMI